MKTRVLLYSGGTDSWCLRHLWRPDVCLYVDMGTEYAWAEIDRLDGGVEVTCLPLARFELDDKIIPLRNLLLVTLAALHGGNQGTTTVALGATAGDRPLDKSYEFATRSGDLLSWLWGPQRWTPGKVVEVVVPAKHLSKAALIARYLEANGDPIALAERSYSCYTPGPAGKPCGQCKACMRRWVALTCNGIESEPDCRQAATDQLLPGILAGSDDRIDENDDVLTALGVVR